MLTLRDGERTPWDNNGSLMVYQRLSRINSGNHTLLTFNQMEDQPISDVPQLTLDGGNYSNTKIPLLSMKEEKLWTFYQTEMLRTKTSKYIPNMEESTNNGILSMLTNGKVNQERESSMKNSVYMLKDHFMLSLNSKQIDTLK